MARKDDGKGAAAPQEGEFRSGAVVGTALVQGLTGMKALQYADVDGEALFEGDIVLGRVDELQAAAEGDVQHGVILTGAQFRWPNGEVPYEIDPALPNQQRVTDAIAHWHANTAVRLVPRSGQTNFVRFRPGSGCSSRVGMRGNQQDITLAAGCTTGNTIHEIGHAVGLWHEQSREDRDAHVTIVWANIDPARQHNFDQHISDGDDVGAYDFGSLMHYPRDAFSLNGNDTIVPRNPLPPGVTMGQRTGLSAGDIAAVNAMYPPAPPTVKEVAKDPVTEPVLTRKEMTKDPIRDVQTLKEVAKDPVRDPVTVKEVGKDPAFDTRKEMTGDIGPRFPNVLTGVGRRSGDAPFVVATPHQYPGWAAEQAADPLTTQLALLEDALTLAQQSAEVLAAAYESAAALAEQLSGQG